MGGFGIDVITLDIPLMVSSGDVLYGPQHIFWTYLNWSIKSRDLAEKNIMCLPSIESIVGILYLYKCPYYIKENFPNK